MESSRRSELEEAWAARIEDGKEDGEGQKAPSRHNIDEGGGLSL